MTMGRRWTNYRTLCRNPGVPLFIGRKPCLPSAPLFGGFSDGDTALAALLAWPLADDVTDGEPIRLQWPVNDGQTDDRVRVSRPDFMLTDQRNWVSGLHGGRAGGSARAT